MTMAKRLELPLPPAGMRFMGEDDDALVQIGRRLADRLIEHGLTETSSVIDVGCGYGRLAIGIVDALPYHGQYLGFDILVRPIAWCAGHMTRVAPNLTFRHLDVRNDRYNPRGRIDPAAMRFPARSGSYDVAAVFSVFTHLHEPAIRHYLAEIWRVLRPGGVAVSTWFVFDADRLQAVTSEQSRFPMRHELGPGIRYSFDEDPLHAIAYDEALIREMVATAGLSVERTERGSWAGEPGRSLQDLVVLRRGEEAPPVDDGTFDLDRAVGRMSLFRDRVSTVRGVGRRAAQRFRRRLRGGTRRA